MEDNTTRTSQDRKTHTMSLENPQDFTTSDTLNLGNSMRITKNNTNLGRCQTLLCKLADIVLNLKIWRLSENYFLQLHRLHIHFTSQNCVTPSPKQINLKLQ